MSGTNQYPGNSGFAGNNWFMNGGAFNSLDFVIRQIIEGKAFSAIVQVKSVSNSGGILPVGTVSVQPMVNQVDGFGNQMPHGTIYNLPYMRVQGGANAVILDPQIGDIGLAVFCDRDNSVVKATKKVGGPGSRRKNDRADGLYIGGFLNGTPTQYVAFSASGIQLVSPTAVTITAPTLTINANIATTGTITNNGHAVDSTHKHTNVTTGTGVSGPPQ